MGSQIQKQYPLVGQTQIYQFGKINIYRDSNNNQFFNKDYTFIADPNATKQFITHLVKKNNTCPYLIQIRNIKQTKENYCSNSVKLTVSFQYINMSLQNLIDRNHQFNQSQIIKLLHNLLHAVKYLHQNQSSHGDISPQFIYADTKAHNQHIYKIFDSVYFQPQFTGYYRAQKQRTFSAPQILTNLGQKKIYPLYDIYASQTFSIGLIILYCMTLINPLGAYNQANQIDYYYIQSMFRLAERKGYNQKLIQVVRECIVHKNRSKPHQILQKFQNMNLQELIKASFNKFSLKKSKNPQNPIYITK